MSYNYLPLDHKPLHFQQIKNLLNYDQLVSITFTAHERISENIEHINSIDFKSVLPEITLTEKNSKTATASKVPLAVIKLLLMLKIKSLGYGTGCVQIETVKTMMEMYNAGNFPAIDFTEDALYVLYQSIQANSKTVLKPEEKYTLCYGQQFTTACGLYTLIKAEVLLNKFEQELMSTPKSSGSTAAKISLKDHFTEEAEEILALTKQSFTACTQFFLKQVNTPTNGLFFSIADDNIVLNKNSTSTVLEIQLDVLLTHLKSLLQFFVKSDTLVSKEQEWLNYINSI